MTPSNRRDPVPSQQGEGAGIGRQNGETRTKSVTVAAPATIAPRTNLAIRSFIVEPTGCGRVGYHCLETQRSLLPGAGAGLLTESQP